MFMTKI